MDDPFSLPLTGTYPWLHVPHSFVGWVPNVSGHLSFGLICANGELNSINHRSAPSGQRTVVVHTRRSAEDFPLPGGLVGVVRRSATQDFVLVARTTPTQTPFISDGEVRQRLENHGALAGLILVVPRDADAIASQRRKQFLQDLDGAIEEALGEASTPGATGPALAEHLPNFIRQRAADAQSEIVCNIARFVLFRTGELRIWFDDKTFHGRDTASVPTTEPEQQAARYLPSQMYFFVKDTAHQHYHHDPETDQILDLHKVESGGEHFDDETWRIDTLRGLAKVVVEYRHSNHPLSNKKALGILAYADAFQSLLAKVRRSGDFQAEIKPLENVIPYDFNHVRSSIEALDALNETKRGALLQLFGILIGVVLSAFALWSGAVQIQPTLCDAMKGGPTPCPKMEPNTAVDVVNWVVANPLGFVMFLAVLGFAAFIIFFKGFASVPMARKIMTWVSRFSSAVATSISQRLGGSDYIGQAIRLLIIGGMAFFSGVLAYWIVPKHEVPTIGELGAYTNGSWTQLDAMVGKKPAESGLFTNSVIARNLRDISGDDYDAFLALMAEASTLRRENVLWVASMPTSSNGRDAAYLIIDQKQRKLEIGLRRGGNTTVYRSPGAVLVKPASIATAFDGVTADMTPLAIQAPVCRSAQVGDGSRTLIFSGTLPVSDHCEYKIPLRSGQMLSYSPMAARGLQMSVGEFGRQPSLVLQSYTAQADGTYLVRISWEQGSTGPQMSRQLRPFYLRARIQ